jgi:hypothetical protein
MGFYLTACIVYMILLTVRKTLIAAKLVSGDIAVRDQSNQAMLKENQNLISKIINSHIEGYNYGIFQ